MSSVLRVAYREIADDSSVISDIAESLNLNVKPYFCDYYGSFNLVANGTADMSGILMSQESKRESRIKSIIVYLHPVDSETSNVYFRQPPADSAKHTIVRPFSIELWIVLLFFMLVVSLISRRSSANSSFWKICIYAVELLLGRHDLHFRLTQVFASIAVVRLIISFFGIIISSVYIGKIASIFVMRDILVKTPNDLIKYKYTINSYSPIHINRIFKEDVTWNEVHFLKGIDFITKVIGKPNDDTRQTVFSHPDGFFTSALYSLNYNQELCKISVIKSVRKTARSFCISKKSPLRETINIRIVQLIERGLNRRHQVNFKSQFEYNCYKEETDFNQLTFRYVQLGFIPLFIGVTLAVGLELIQLINRIKTLNQAWKS